LAYVVNFIRGIECASHTCCFTTVLTGQQEIGVVCVSGDVAAGVIVGVETVVYTCRKCVDFLVSMPTWSKPPHHVKVNPLREENTPEGVGLVRPTNLDHLWVDSSSE
jgi:hypothetical protein